MTTQAPFLPPAGRSGDRSPAGLPHRARLVLVRCADETPETRAARPRRLAGALFLQIAARSRWGRV